MLSDWIQAARPRTLAAGAAPVAVGTALAGTVTAIDWLAATACLAGAVLIQIGCNFANDACDGLKGTDGPGRLGPTRAVASGRISARAMLVATGVVLALAFLIGLYLTAKAGWAIFILGVVSLVCAVAYTAGPYALAYIGLGDLFVFLFFGLAAVLGSAWVQVARLGEALPWTWWMIAAAVGLQATAIIVVNNLRDIPTDRVAGKRTVAVRIGDAATRHYYLLLHLTASALLAVAAWQWLPWLEVPACIAWVGGIGCWLGLRRRQGAELNPWLGRTAALELVTAIALAVVLTWAAPGRPGV